MNIDEIRAEIPKTIDKLDRKGLFDVAVGKSTALSFAEAAYEAGVKRGGEISISALNEVELRENPVYQKGYEAGKAVDFEAHCDAIENNRQKWFEAGFEHAAKDPKAWYVLDKNGEKIHIGDTVYGAIGNMKVEALGDGWIRAIDCDAGCNLIEKVILDTREKIKHELMSYFIPATYDGDDVSRGEDLAEQFIARIEALERD